MMSTVERLRNIGIFVCLIGFISLWNIPHTIAARYLFAGLLLVIVVISKPHWKHFFQSNVALLILFAYLIVHLVFFSIDFGSALDNFSSEWLKLILFSILGAGTGLLVPKRHYRILLPLFALAFSVPLLIHVGLSIHEGFVRGNIPWGYFGLSGAQSVSGTHGDLAYAAIPATIFASVFLLYQARNRFEIGLSLVLLAACITSPFVANSRAGTAFVFFALILVLLVNFATKFHESAGRGKRIMGLIAILLGLPAIVMIGSAADPTRWTGVAPRLEMGLKGDPLQIVCEGVDSLRHDLEKEGRVITPEVSQALISIQERQDGARVVTARAGLRLSWANPMGIDQSKEAYQIAIRKVCTPAISLSNTHNGWIDTALAIGIPGAILYLLVLLNFARIGFRHAMARNEINTPYAVALVVTSTIWIIRSLVDSAQRDQMLEMQAFTLTCLAGLVINQKQRLEK